MDVEQQLIQRESYQGLLPFLPLQYLALHELDFVGEIKMDEIFKEASARRRGNESILTSRISNIRWYGSPTFYNTREMWPPMSTIPNPTTSDQDPSSVSTEPDQENSQKLGEDQNTAREIHLPMPGDLREHLAQLTASHDSLYHALHNGNTIRILNLHPGEFRSLLSCNFQYISLQHFHPQYEALSYVWGDKEEYIFDKTTMEHRAVTYSITCNGHEKEITSNLDRALRYIRKPSESVVLWIDALCINQDDHQERGHQVTLMGSIYSKAKQVLIWVDRRMKKSIFYSQPELGMPPRRLLRDIQAQRAFGAICDIVNRWKETKSQRGNASYTVRSSRSSRSDQIFTTFESYPSVARDFEDQNLMANAYEHNFSTSSGLKYVPKYGYYQDRAKEEVKDFLPDNGIDCSTEEAISSQFWHSLSELFQKSWFWRVWIIQEAVLAKKAVVKWANVEIDWRWVGLAAAIIRNSYHGICERLNMGGVYNAYLVFRMSRLSDIPPPELPFVQLLKLTRQFEVTDPRDRVYGLLGMKTSDNDPEKGLLYLQPDYTISANQLWMKLATKVIQHSENLSILSSVQYSTEMYESENAIEKGRTRWTQEADDVLLPSWVPDWDTLYRNTLNAWDTDDNFAAAKNLPFTATGNLHGESHVLTVAGIAIGTAGYAGGYMWHDVDTDILLAKDLGGYFTSRAGFHLLARTFTAGRNAYGSLTDSGDTQAASDLAAYILALQDGYNQDSTRHRKYKEHERFILNSISYEPRAAKDFGDIFDMYPGFREILAEWAKSGEAARFRQTAVALCDRRRLFLTLNGFVGLGPDTAREGDIVVILSGSDVPMLLRPVSKTESRLEDRLESQTIKDQQQLYLLVGECYIEGLMFGEAVQALNEDSALRGPVPVTSVLQQIVSYANDNESDCKGRLFPSDRLERKKECLEEGKLYTVEMIEEGTKVHPKKELFTIL